MYIIETKDKKLIKKFICNIGSSANNFKYFNNRSLDCIDNHILTILGIVNNIPVAYGHLDFEDKIWLGICIAENETSKGYGKLILKYLLNYADNNKLDVNLSVYINNIVAIKLYEKNGFNKISENNEILFYERKSSV